jgi:hypothetical protein
MPGGLKPGVVGSFMVGGHIVMQKVMFMCAPMVGGHIVMQKVIIICAPMVGGHIVPDQRPSCQREILPRVLGPIMERGFVITENT